VTSDPSPHSPSEYAALFAAPHSVEHPGSRLTRQAVFIIPPGKYEEPEKFRNLSREPSYQDLPLESAIALVPELQDEIAAGEVRIEPGGYGRGADTVAIAAIVAALAALPAGLNQLIDFYQRVARTWRKLRAARRTPISLSLGSIEALCALDLLAKLGTLDEIRLRWSGDVGGGLRVDLGYTGEDLFLILFVHETSGRVWLYLVDSQGRLLHLGGAQQHPDTYFRSSPGIPHAPEIENWKFLLDNSEERT